MHPSQQERERKKLLELFLNHVPMSQIDPEILSIIMTAYAPEHIILQNPERIVCGNRIIEWNIENLSSRSWEGYSTIKVKNARSG